MNKQEIERRLATAKLKTQYYQSLLDGNPIEVQYFVDCKWFTSNNPTFSDAFMWREKPAEPKVIYRWQAHDCGVWYTESAPTRLPSDARNVERYVQDVEWKAGEQ